MELNEDIYDPHGVSKEIDTDEFIHFINDDLFHIGQFYEKKPVQTAYCKKCGGKDFNVGQGNYYTAIRCITCEYEVLIHEG